MAIHGPDALEADSSTGTVGSEKTLATFDFFPAKCAVINRVESCVIDNYFARWRGEASSRYHKPKIKMTSCVLVKMGNCTGVI